MSAQRARTRCAGTRDPTAGGHPARHNAERGGGGGPRAARRRHRRDRSAAQSPEPLESIRLLVEALAGQAVIGAGTVLREDEVDAVAAAGADIVLSPNFNAQVVGLTKALGLYSMTGVATASEGFDALAAGADALKLFPGDLLGPPLIKAWRSVFPSTTPMFIVGGINRENLPVFKAAGASGAGIGSALYAPGMPAVEAARRARDFVARWQT